MVASTAAGTYAVVVVARTTASISTGGTVGATAESELKPAHTRRALQALDDAVVTALASLEADAVGSG